MTKKRNQKPEETMRRRMPSERESITKTFSIGGFEGELTVGLFEDGSPGEVFIKAAQLGSTVSGFTDAWAIAVSLGLQHGVPVETIVRKFCDRDFPPNGHTGDQEIPFAKSIVAFCARFLEVRFVKNKAKPVKAKVA
jgi:ribonucleoside-diphosphate reductase alpha chain